MKFKILLVSISAGALLIPLSAISQETNPSELMRVVSHELVSKKRISRTEFDYEYKITAENNTNTDYSGVFVTASIDSPSVKIIDKKADIGQMNAFSKTAGLDTITVRVDRTAQFNPANLAYAFDNDTLEGIDTDGNGVKDNVDSYIRKNFSDSGNIRILEEIAQLERSAVFADELSETMLLRQELVKSQVCAERLGINIDMIGLDFSELQFDSDARQIAFSQYRQKVFGQITEEIPSQIEIDIHCAGLL